MLTEFNEWRYLSNDDAVRRGLRKYRKMYLSYFECGSGDFFVAEKTRQK